MQSYIDTISYIFIPIHSLQSCSIFLYLLRALGTWLPHVADKEADGSG
jgi:hypothetical protein